MYIKRIIDDAFILLLPLLIIFNIQIEPSQKILTATLSLLILWAFVTLEKVGSNSEDPFEGRVNDVSITALYRTTEIDLRDMLDNTGLPPKVQPKDNILY